MIQLDITLTDTAGPLLTRIRTGLANRAQLHRKIAGDAEAYLKKSGAAKAKTQHRSAETLGAKPTKHLEKAYQAIEGTGTADGALLRMPRASRLRAAFGEYVLRPGSGRKYLTIPAHPEAYGRRAGEFPDLFFVRVGPRQTAALARKVDGRETMEILFFLTKSARIKHAPDLIRFDLLAEAARDTVEEYIDGLRNGGQP